MKKILITGTSGFVGMNLVRYCDEHNIKTFTLNLRQQFPLHIPSGIDGIVHLAGKAHDTKNISDPSEYFAINTDITKKLFDLFLLSDASFFIFLSSVKAAADSSESILDENVIPNPQTHYGKSKLLAEQYIQSVELPYGKSYYILRPCMIHGAGNKGNLNLLYQFVSKGIPWPLASFDNQRSFLSVDNICFIIKELIERDDIEGGIYNVADDDTVSTNELISLIAMSKKRKLRMLHVPKILINFLSKIGDYFWLPLNTERVKKLTEKYIVSNEKIKRAIRKPLPIESKKGLLKTFESFRKYE